MMGSYCLPISFCLSLFIFFEGAENKFTHILRAQNCTDIQSYTYFHCFHFFLLTLGVKPRTLKKANLITILAKNPHGEKDKEGRLSLDVGGNPSGNTLRTTHAMGKGLKTKFT